MHALIPPAQVVARYGYMDIVDHGPAFIASVIKYIGLQLADIADPTGDLLLHQTVSQQGQEPPATASAADGGEGDVPPLHQMYVAGERSSRSARFPLPALPEDAVRNPGLCVGEGEVGRLECMYPGRGLGVNVGSIAPLEPRPPHHTSIVITAYFNLGARDPAGRCPGQAGGSSPAVTYCYFHPSAQVPAVAQAKQAD